MIIVIEFNEFKLKWQNLITISLILVWRNRVPNDLWTDISNAQYKYKMQLNGKTYI